MSVEALLKSFADSQNRDEKFFATALHDVNRSEWSHVVKRDGEDVGIAYIFTDRHLIRSLGMAVKSSYQGHGIGNELMAEALEYTKSKKTYLTSGLGKPNYRIINLHRKVGFRLLYTGKHYIDWWYIAFSVRSEAYCRLILKPLLVVHDYV